MHELYLWPFADAVRAGVGSVMWYDVPNLECFVGLEKSYLTFVQLLQPSQQLLCLPKFESPQRPSEK
jgi:hypothetical protein